MQLTKIPIKYALQIGSLIKGYQGVSQPDPAPAAAAADNVFYIGKYRHSSAALKYAGKKAAPTLDQISA